ncbi:MAG: VOC family protein [Casimicrobiaceae bacterium]
MTAAARATLDHLVVAADTLEQGEEHLEALLGVQPQRGGRHVAMGTHNSLVQLGPRCFLEVIAIDPDAAAPARPRWFDLDRPAMRALLAQSPRLIHWAARTEDIEASRRACPIDPGPMHPMARGSFRWRITVPDDGHRPGDGVLPTLIQWDDARHPADELTDTGLRIASLAAAHPEPAAVRASLASLGLSETLKVTFAAAPRLAAMLSTPRGNVTL